MGQKTCKIQKPLLGKLNDNESEKFKIFDRENKRPLPFCCCFNPQTKTILSISNLFYQVNVSLGFITVTMIQTYENNLEEHTDLEYVFSTRSNAAFIKLEVEFGDKKLIGLIKEKQVAQQEYLDGIQQGKTMVYSDQADEFPDIMRFKLGNLAPKSKLIVNYQYIQPLEVCVNEFWKIELEQVVHPRYQLEPHNIKAFKSLEQFINFGSFNYYNFKQDISITFDLPTPITFCQSPTHKITRKEKGKFHDKDQVLLNPFYQENFQADKGFVLLFSNFQIHQPIVSLSCTDRDELKQEQYCATISFIPKFNPQELDDAYQAFLDQEDFNAQEFQYQQKGEYIFLLDRSGSMSGNRIQKAKQAICLFIRSLPQDSYFNVVSFGSNYEKIWTESQKYSKDSATEALQKVEEMKADLGGTEILTPLQKDIYKQLRQEGYPLNIFILTDGEVSPDPIVDLVRQMSKPDIKVYCLGIGDGCSKFLVEKVVWVGNGKFHFICDNEDLNSKVIDLLQDSITPQLENFELVHNVKNPYCIIPNPQSVICLKKNKQFTIQILFPKQDIDQLNFVIKWYDPQIKKQCSFDINILQSLASKQDQFHKLAAYKLIQILEDAYLYEEENVENLLISKESINLADIVGISVTHQVLSRATAFICEVSEPNDDMKEKLKQKVLVKQDQSNYVEKKSLDRTKLKKSQVKKSKQCVRKQELKLECSQQRFCQQDTFKCLEQDKPQLHHDFLDYNRIQDTKAIDIGDQDQVQNEFHDDKSPTDINVPAFVKKRSEQRHQKEQEQRNLERQQKQELRKQEEQVQDINIYKQNIIGDVKQQMNHKNEISTLEILKFAEIDGQFNLDILKLFNFKEFIIPEGLNEQLWINIVVVNYLELQCQKDKVIWQLIVKKTVEHLTRNNIKHQAYREQVLDLIKEFK